MPKILETHTITLHWGGTVGPTTARGNTRFGTIGPDYDALPGQVDAAVAELNDDGWEIKSVTPIAETYFASAVLQNSEGMLGLVKSNAGSETIAGTYTAGVIILAQRWTEISEADFAERKRQREQKLAAAAEEERLNAGPNAYDQVMNMPIERTGGIMSSMWRFNGEEYHTEGQAKRVRQEMADRARDEAEPKA